MKTARQSEPAQIATATATSASTPSPVAIAFDSTNATGASGP